ncbi:hypothetical protein [Actinomadura gamaensis]|uniref:Uncharacterized protein n=1 Tax=Actinomadura gamaensis TaxID=1763541 RepID=A0ABV9TXH7_9ACTN
MQSVQSVYGAQSGTTHSQGMAFGAVIGAGPMAMSTSSHGVHASNLALRLAPPPQPVRQSPWNCGIFALLASIVGFSLIPLLGWLVEHDPMALAVFVAVLCAVPVVVLLVLVRGQRLKQRHQVYAARWPAMMRIWQSAMICLRCHGTYFPPDALPAGLRPSQLLPVDLFQATVADLGARFALAAASPSSPLQPGE